MRQVPITSESDAGLALFLNERDGIAGVWASVVKDAFS